MYVKCQIQTYTLLIQMLVNMQRLYRRTSQFVTNVLFWSLARIHVKTEDQDSAKKMTSIWGKIDSSRFILSDYAIALSNPFFQNPKNFKQNFHVGNKQTALSQFHTQKVEGG